MCTYVCFKDYMTYPMSGVQTCQSASVLGIIKSRFTSEQRPPRGVHGFNGNILNSLSLLHNDDHSWNGYADIRSLRHMVPIEKCPNPSETLSTPTASNSSKALGHSSLYCSLSWLSPRLGGGDKKTCQDGYRTQEIVIFSEAGEIADNGFVFGFCVLFKSLCLYEKNDQTLQDSTNYETIIGYPWPGKL